jgi:hypothetical protein
MRWGCQSTSTRLPAGRVIHIAGEQEDGRDRLKAVELLGQLAEFDLFARNRT